MNQTERDQVIELWQNDRLKDLLMVIEHADPIKRREIIEYLSGWNDAMGHYLDRRDSRRIDALLRKLEDSI
jgi:hypothetical protein